MKLYDIKLKEIDVLENKMKDTKDKLDNHKPSSNHNKSKKLKAKLTTQKKVVADSVKEVVSHHDKFFKIISSYNKKFATKNKSSIKELLNQITLQLKDYMAKKHFKEAYKKFMVIVIEKILGLNPDAIKNGFTTAKMLIKNHFMKLLKKVRRR